MDNPINTHYLHTRIRKIAPPIQLYYVETLDSTNRFLKDLTISPHTWVCCIADEQTAGRGRFGKRWISPKGVNIYCSLGFHLPPSAHPLGGLSLITGLAVLAMLTPHLPSRAYLKWPNDVLYQHRKFCGILIEQHLNQIVIGIGINVNVALPASPHIDKPWGSLYELTGYFFDRNVLLVDLLEKLTSYVQRFWKSGLSDFMNEWQQVDYLVNKKIKMSIQEKESIGYARGITTTGELIFEDLQGEMHYLTSGNASLLNFL